MSAWVPGRREVLDLEYIPRDLHHRDGQIQQLRDALAGVLTDGSARIVTIFGPSGSGKTTLAKYVSERFEEEAWDLETGYANCIDEQTPTQVLQTLVNETGLFQTPPPRSVSDCMALFRDASDPLVLTVDDLGHLDDPAFIKSLTGIRGVGVILIGIDEDEILATMPAGLRNRVRTARVVRLKPYTNQQLVVILWGRIELGFHPGIFTRPGVRAIAEWAKGDAYQAIALLRECLETVEVAESGSIDREFVTEVAAAFVPPPHELGTHERLLYNLIEEAESITGRELKQRYEERSPTPRGNSARNRYLQTLEERGLISSTGTGRGKRYHFEGR